MKQSSGRAGIGIIFFIFLILCVAIGVINSRINVELEKADQIAGHQPLAAASRNPSKVRPAYVEMTPAESFLPQEKVTPVSAGSAQKRKSTVVPDVVYEAPLGSPILVQ